MFCTNCGKELDDGVKFCPHCGTAVKIHSSDSTSTKTDATDDSQKTTEKENSPKEGFQETDSKETTPKSENQTQDSQGSNESQNYSEKKNNTIDDTIDKIGDEIGGGIESAVNELKDDFKNAEDTFSKTMDKAEDISSNWKSYFTFENMEKLSALSLIIPVFMLIACKILDTVFGFAAIRFSFFLIIPTIVRCIFILVSVAAFVCVVYLLIMNEAKRSLWSIIILVGSTLSLLSCSGIFFKHEAWPFVTSIICLIWGICSFSHIVLRNKGIETAPEIGEDLKAYHTWYKDYKANHPSGEEYERQRIANDPEASYFDGKGITLFGLNLLTILLSIITCSLATPWMMCKVMRWKKSHTVINGRRLAFNGTGGSLLGHWLLWELLTVVTCGIYSFFMYVAFRKWEMQHTTYEDEPLSPGLFDGNSFQYFGYGLLQILLMLITCGLAAPWTITMITKWETRHEVVSGNRLMYDGTALGILGQYIIVFIFSIITLGLYAPWGTVRLNKYVYKHTHVNKQATP